MPVAAAAVMLNAGFSLAAATVVRLAVGFAIKALIFVALDVAVRKMSSKGKTTTNQDFSRDISTRGAIEPRKIIYGESLVSGPVVYNNCSGTDNKYLWFVIPMAGHHCWDMTEVWLDDTQITAAEVNWGGAVTGSGKFAGYALFEKNYGSSTQTTSPLLAAAFPTDFTSDHRGRGIAYLVARFELVEASNNSAFAAGAPRNIKALVQGKWLYDPRKDPASARYSGSGFHDINDPATWEWSDNPALCAADYMTDERVGMRIPKARIDYETVADEANYCDGLSNTDSGTEKRFTCNGVLYTSDTHRDNLLKILSSMNGRLSYTKGKYRIRAGRMGQGANIVANGTFDADTDWTKGAGVTIAGGQAVMNTAAVTALQQSGLLVVGTAYHVSYQVLNYVSGEIRPQCGASGANGTLVDADGFYNELIEATDTNFTFNVPVSFQGDIDNVEVHKVTDVTINENWLAGDVKVKTAPPKRERYNTFHGIIRDGDRGYKDAQTLPVSQADYVTRDGEVLIREMPLPMTNSEIEAQRIMFKQLFATDQQKTAILECNYAALDVAIHDFVRVSISELSWTKKLFRVVNWEFRDIDEGGINLVLREDSSTSYAEPDQNDFSVRDASGTVIIGDPGVPAPTNFTATAVYNGILLECTLPTPSTSWDVLELYASPTSAWSSAVLVARGRQNYSRHILPVGTTRYYWVRAKKDSEVSLRNPNNDTSTITATAGAVIDANSTIGGQTVTTIQNNAQSGYNIQQALEVSGTTILAGVLKPTNTGAVAVGTITWNSTTGALTGGTGIAITEFGIIGATSGVATFTLEAATGNATFSGVVSTSQYVYATGGVTVSGFTAGIYGDTSAGISVMGRNTGVGGYGVLGLKVASSGVAVRGLAVFAGAIGGEFIALNSTEVALAVGTGKMTKARNANSLLHVYAPGGAEIAGSPFEYALV
jgi:hypothetical protein